MPDIKGRTLLVVGDDTVREAIDALARVGARVFPARDIESAVKLVDAVKVDAVLCERRRDEIERELARRGAPLPILTVESFDPECVIRAVSALAGMR